MKILHILIIFGISWKSGARSIQENQEDVLRHNLVWKGSLDTDLDQSLKSNLEPGDFFYIFSGDSQHFYRCTSENTACLSKTPECKKSITDQCIEKQSEWSNRYQRVSMRKLIAQLTESTGQLPRGLILNGDLIQTGTEKEMNIFRNYWENFDDRFPIYPGLGNHDYSNNIDQCEGNNCVQRVLTYFTKYVTEKLSRSIDLKNETKFGKISISGSLAYSWDECSTNFEKHDGTCFHFVQENNYPTYTRNISTNSTNWTIVPSLNWLENDLKSNKNNPIIINLHDFDTWFSEKGKDEFRKILVDKKADVIAVFFAHVHERVGLRSNWCLEHLDGRPTYFFYSGSVPGNNYVLAHFSSTKRNLKKLYKVHVVDEVTSSVESETLSASCPRNLHNSG